MKNWIAGGLVLLLAACTSTNTTTTTTEDRSWTPQDETAVTELAAAAVVVLPEAPQTVPTLSAGSRLEIYLFNLGQADSMLVVGPAPARKTLLVDLGTRTDSSQLPPGFTSSADHVLRRIREITGANRVDYFVLTHYHGDHAGFGADRAAGWGAGIIKALSDFAIPFEVGEFIHVQDEGTQFMAPASERGVFSTIQRRMPVWVNRGRVGTSSKPQFGTSQIDLGTGVAVDIVAFAGRTPGGSAFDKAANAGVDYTTSPANENDLSIAMEISAGEFELFTAGDLSGTDDPVRHPLFVPRTFNNPGGVRRETFTNVEDHMAGEWASTGRESDVEIYRADHHGSFFSTTQKLLDILDPEFVLYSTGAGHGHPSSSIVQRAGATARQLATTAVNNLTAFQSARGRTVGEIRIVVAADGNSYTINGEKHLAFTAAAERNGDDRGEEDRQH